MRGRWLPGPSHSWCPVAEQVELNRGTKLIVTADKAWNLTTAYRGPCTIGVEDTGEPYIRDPGGNEIEATFDEVKL